MVCIHEACWFAVCGRLEEAAAECSPLQCWVLCECVNAAGVTRSLLTQGCVSDSDLVQLRLESQEPPSLPFFC